MAKEAYVDKVSELASKCLTFAQATCRQWREQTSGEEPGWQGLNEPVLSRFWNRAIGDAHSRVFNLARPSIPRLST